MTQQIEHPEVQNSRESDTLVHEAEALDHETLTVPEEWTRVHGTSQQGRRLPVRWMRWLGAAVVVVAATGVTLLFTRGGDDTVAPASEIVSIEHDWDHLLLNPAANTDIVSIEHDWDHLLLNPAANTDIVSIEHDWDHLLLNPPADTEIVEIVSIEHDWDHLLLDPAADTDIVSIEHDWDHLLLGTDG